VTLTARGWQPQRCLLDGIQRLAAGQFDLKPASDSIYTLQSPEQHVRFGVANRNSCLAFQRLFQFRSYPHVPVENSSASGTGRDHIGKLSRAEDAADQYIQTDAAPQRGGNVFMRAMGRKGLGSVIGEELRLRLDYPLIFKILTADLVRG